MTARSRMALLANIDWVQRLPEARHCVLTCSPQDYLGFELMRNFHRLREVLKARGLWPAAGVRVTERHARGGYHIHVVASISHDVLDSAWRGLGGGHVWSRAVKDSDLIGQYLVRDLGKKGQKDIRFRGRAWSSWGKGKVTGADFASDTPEARQYRACVGDRVLSKRQRWAVMKALARARSMGVDVESWEGLQRVRLLPRRNVRLMCKLSVIS